MPRRDPTPVDDGPGTVSRNPAQGDGDCRTATEGNSDEELV